MILSGGLEPVTHVRGASVLCFRSVWVASKESLGPRLPW